MKKGLVAFALLLGGLSSMGQNNVLSLHIQPLFLGELRLGYEHATSRGNSIVLNGGYFFQSRMPQFLYEDPAFTNNGTTIVTQNSMEGYDFVPEFRFYVGKAEAPRGFYIAPYLKWSSYQFEMMDQIVYTFDESDIPNLDPEVQEQIDEDFTLDVQVELDADLKQNGVGIQFGYQIPLGKRWTIDMLVLGLEVDRTSLTGRVVSQSIDVDYAEWVTQIEEASEDWARWPYVETLEMEALDNGIEVEAKGLMPWYRGGIKIGFKF